VTSTGEHTKTPRVSARLRYASDRGRRDAPAIAVLVLAALCAAAGTPATAGAYATAAPAPVAGPPGLPDGRVYEQVSPPNKNGNTAAGPGNGSVPLIAPESGGQGVAYNVTGSIGQTESGFQVMDIAKRGAEGWASAGAQPRAIGPNGQTALFLKPVQLGFSEDMSHVLFWSNDRYLTETLSPNATLVYDISSGLVSWLDPPPASQEAPQIAGFSSDFSTVYFRTESGLYESHDGVESVAGVLPDGSIDPEALPAGSATNRQTGIYDMRHQLSEDGSRAFFVSGLSTPQLYVHETAPDGTARTVLASRDTLLGPGGEPTPAPDGVLQIIFPESVYNGEELSAPPSQNPHSAGYAYASPDGSRVFFASADQLTSAAPPGGGMYEFNTAGESLTYLPGVGASPILVSSHDGSRFLFNGPAGVSLWSEEGPGGGTVTPIEPLPVGGEARATPDGSVFVFESAAPFVGFNNGGTHLDLEKGEGPFSNQEIYRYDVAENSVSCVSCPPKGVTPSGNAFMSHDTRGALNGTSPLFEARGISADGSRVFFDSPDPLVAQDTNTAPLEFRAGEEVLYHEYGRDVYEWENGRIYLISTGTSAQGSYIGGSSVDGNDVFFSTAQGLEPGDTDEAYDLYDARVPRPGDHAPPPPAPCEGDVCQGPPSVPALLGAPSSATFNGLGNPEPTVTPPPPKTVTKKPVKCAKGKKLSHGKCVKSKSKKKSKKASRARKSNYNQAKYK
jgi:hypothetical protein